MGISADRVENVLWRAQDICLEHTTLFVVMHSGTNNVDQRQPEDIAVGVLKIAETFVKNNPKTAIITGMLPRGKTYSFQCAKIDETNKILKAKSKNLPQTYFIDQDDDRVRGDMILHENLRRPQTVQHVGQHVGAVSYAIFFQAKSNQHSWIFIHSHVDYLSKMSECEAAAC